MTARYDLTHIEDATPNSKKYEARYGKINISQEGWFIATFSKSPLGMKGLALFIEGARAVGVSVYDDTRKRYISGSLDELMEG